MSQPNDRRTVQSDTLGDFAEAQSAGVDGALRWMRHWWKSQTAPRIEDEIVDRSGGRSMSTFVVPVVAPVLIVPSILLFREPDNPLVIVTLIAGCAALVYSVLGGHAERRAKSPFWFALANGFVYSTIISVLLYVFITVDHPRTHIHWVLFFLYFMMIGANGMSDDPRQPAAAGAFAIAGYLVVLIAFRAHLAVDPSTIALELADEFEWVANAAKIFLLISSSLVAISSARRGRELRRSSLRDGLTGLLNRHAFDQCLEYLGRSAAGRGERLTVAMIDIDHFKRLNDGYGHATGDDVIRWVASALQRNFRATDLVARYGGEEFVVAFPASARVPVEERLERVRQVIASRALRARGVDADVSVTVSIGAARFPEDGDSVHDVLAVADALLYDAKHAGRDRVVMNTAPA